MRNSKVYSFKITLDGPRPQVWRRIEVPDTYTFWDLHVAIQDAMGWEDAHLHEFKVKKPSGTKMSIGIPDGQFGMNMEPGWMVRISGIFSGDNPRALYIYDFGDGWLHKLKLEDILKRQTDVEYPRCVAGKRACPPEDCGGMMGYLELLKALADPMHKAHCRAREWLGPGFDPERFDLGKVTFTDPAERLKNILE